MTDLAEAAALTGALGCLDCGKCTASCPISQAGADYSPRRHVLAANTGDRADLTDGTLWQCLTCSQCDHRCPVGVDYTDLVKRLRAVSHGDGERPECPHGGALQSIMRMMAGGGAQQNRMSWMTDDLRTVPEQGEVFFWTGCAMYYDAFFQDFEVKTLDGTRAAIRLLNSLGVDPVVSPEERCCGHDLLWNGDLENFEKLARHNVDLVEKSGASTVVTPCAECLRTWSKDYGEFFSGVAPRVMHLTEYLAENRKDLKLGAGEARKVTFQDPCRLGRHLGVYEPPRDLLNAVPGVELAEMAHAKSSALCCAGGTWSNCDRFSKAIQVDRLREARATGADVLATACPKCQVHFKCTMKDPVLGEEISIEMKDVSEILAEALL